MSLTTTNPTDLRKAAILFRSLEPESAAVLLGQLSAAEARLIRGAIRELGEIDDAERQSVAAALRARSDATLESQPTQDERYGVELQLSAPHADDDFSPPLPSPAPMPKDVAPPAVGENPFDGIPQLEEVDTVTLAAYLSNENAGVIAVVLSYLPAQRAAALLEELPFELRADALDRLARLGDGDAESLKVLAADLATWITQQQNERQRRASRLETVSAILGAADPESRAGLVRQLTDRGRSWVEAVAPSAPEPEEPIAEADSTPLSETEPQADSRTHEEEPEPETAPVPEVEPPRQPRIPFAAMEKLPPPLLAQVMKRTPPRQLLLALAGAPEGLQKRIESLIPAKQRRQLRARLDSLGRTNLREVAEAQLAMATTASDLWAFFYDRQSYSGWPTARRAGK